MVKIDLQGCKPFIKDADYVEYVEHTLTAFDTLEKEDGAGNDFLGWKHLPSQCTESLILESEMIAENWRNKGVDLVVVIGIGGSYLGARCVLEALEHSFSKQLKKLKNKDNSPEVVFAGNNLSEEYISELFDLIKERNVACVVISKSGTTLEPAVAFRLVKNHIENNYRDDFAERIVAITDEKKGALKTLATQENYKTFIIPENVGGRFSVFTPVGILPIVLAGLDIRSIMMGAEKMEEQLSIKSKDNEAVKYAAMRNLLYSKYGKKVEIMVNYNPKFSFLAEWWKQLYGESEGKEHKGIFPASVNNTTDLHSMGQFIQDGERLMFETIINIKKSNRTTIIPEDKQNLDGLNYLANKPVEHCNSMALLGTKLAHIKGGVPQIEINIDKIEAGTLGELLYFFEYSCALSAYTLGVNPFNQPGVEDYKKEMRALL